MLKRGVTSKEHDECVITISKKLNLNIVEVIGNSNIKGKYFPDITSNNTDYEVEVVPRKYYLLKKVVKWDMSRKKILILKVNSFAEEQFNEIFIEKDGDLIKFK